MNVTIPDGVIFADALDECVRAAIATSEPVSFRFGAFRVTIERDDAKPVGKVAGGPMGGEPIEYVD